MKVLLIRLICQERKISEGSNWFSLCTENQNFAMVTLLIISVGDTKNIYSRPEIRRGKKSAVKKTPFLVQLKYFVPSYFVNALKTSLVWIPSLKPDIQILNWLYLGSFSPMISKIVFFQHSKHWLVWIPSIMSYIKIFVVG